MSDTPTGMPSDLTQLLYLPQPDQVQKFEEDRNEFYRTLGLKQLDAELRGRALALQRVAGNVLNSMPPLFQPGHGLLYRVHSQVLQFEGQNLCDLMRLRAASALPEVAERRTKHFELGHKNDCLAPSDFCSAPGCGSADGILVCANCSAPYCSRRCQVRHWEQHRTTTCSTTKPSETPSKEGGSDCVAFFKHPLKFDFDGVGIGMDAFAVVNSVLDQCDVGSEIQVAISDAKPGWTECRGQVSKGLIKADHIYLDLVQTASLGQPVSSSDLYPGQPVIAEMPSSMGKKRFRAVVLGPQAIKSQVQVVLMDEAQVTKLPLSAIFLVNPEHFRSATAKGVILRAPNPDGCLPPHQMSFKAVVQRKEYRDERLHFAELRLVGHEGAEVQPPIQAYPWYATCVKYVVFDKPLLIHDMQPFALGPEDAVVVLDFSDYSNQVFVRSIRCLELLEHIDSCLAKTSLTGLQAGQPVLEQVLVYHDPDSSHKSAWRCVVEQIDSRKQQAWVRCIDHGPKLLIPFDNLYQLPKGLGSQRYPWCASLVTLALVPEIPLEQVQHLTQLAPQLLCPMKMEGENIIRHPNGSTLNDLFLANLADKPSVWRQTEGTFQALIKECHFVTLNKHLNPDVVQNVVLLYVYSLQELYVCPRDQISSAAYLMHRIQNFCSLTGIFRSESYKLGSVCLARSQNDGQWYRGCVLSYDLTTDLYRVFFADFGFQEFLSPKHMMPIDRSLMNVPFLACWCSLKQTDHRNNDLEAVLREASLHLSTIRIRVLNENQDPDNDSHYIVQLA